MPLTRRKLIFAALLTLPLYSISYSQTPSSDPVTDLRKYPNGNYSMLIAGLPFTTLTPAEAQQVVIDRAEASKVPSLKAALDTANALIDQQKLQLANYKQLADLDASLLALRKQMDDVRGSIIGVQQSQHQDAVKLMASMEAVEASGKKSFLDKLPLRLAFTGASFAANVKSLYVREPSPCTPAGMVPAVTLRLGKR